MRRTARIFGLVAGLYFIGRAVAEVFVINASDPASYRADWGGPTLPGVLAVHCGPGIVAAILIGAAVIHRRAASRAAGRRVAARPPDVRVSAE